MTFLIQAIAFIISLLFFLAALAFLNKLSLRIIRPFHFLVEDVRVDEFFIKAAILGEMDSHSKDILPENRVTSAYEKTISIVTDVLLQNGYNPRQYNLKALVFLARFKLGLDTIPKEMK